MKILCSLIVILCVTPAFAAKHTKDSPETVQKNVKADKAQLIDVREPAEWKAGHLKDATLLSLSTLSEKPEKEQLEKVLKQKKIVYLHCASGFRCLKAADILSEYGYEVRPLKQGYDDLREAGFEKAEK